MQMQYGTGWYDGAAPQGVRTTYYAGTPEHVAAAVRRGPVQKTSAVSSKQPMVFVPQQLTPAAKPGQPVIPGPQQRIKLILEYPSEQPTAQRGPGQLQYCSYEPFRHESHPYDPYAFGVDPARFDMGYQVGPAQLNAGAMYDDAWNDHQMQGPQRHHGPHAPHAPHGPQAGPGQYPSYYPSGTHYL